VTGDRSDDELQAQAQPVCLDRDTKTTPTQPQPAFVCALIEHLVSRLSFQIRARRVMVLSHLVQMAGDKRPPAGADVANDGSKTTRQGRGVITWPVD
jgi:hypothetical protein